MAKIQQIGAITVWMIVFVGLWLASTVFLVILYTGQEELRTDMRKAIDAKNRAISDEEEDRIKLVAEARPEGPTIVGLLEQARSTTAELATGQPTDDAASVKAKRDQLLARMAGDATLARRVNTREASLLEALTGLYEAYRADRALLNAEQERASRNEAQVKELIAQTEAQKQEFDSRAREFAARLEESESGRKQYREERDAMIARLEKEFEASLADSTATLTQERQRLAAVERENTELRRRLIDVQERFGEAMVGTRELTTIREPDGTVLLAVPGDDVVYINLGEKDRILLGMQFNVYSPELGIPADGRGKGVIEVVSIGPASSECRIVRLAGHQVIVQDDWIANPVYDRSRPLTFATIGEFDLDRDGQADPDGVASVEALITTWGGKITTELSAVTDFVVLGMAPRRPRAAGELTGEQADRQIAVQEKWEAYNQRLSEAQRLAIPVLPQDVFLRFLGYRDTQTRR